MSGSGDNFGEDIAVLENVRQLESTDYLREYSGVLADTDEQVHIITLAPELADIDAAVDAFRQVSDQWYNASANANIRPIRERGTNPRPWIALPDDSAETLATVQPDFSPDAIETVIAETADALRTLGLYNTVHGHLSPDDIYLPNGIDRTDNLTVEVGGFGLEAAIQGAIGEDEPTAYTAPELLDGANQPTEQTDVYGLGAVTYFTLTGHAPVAGSDLPQAISDGPTNPPSTHADGIEADVDEVVMQALSTSPGDRYESPYAFHRAFLSVFDPDVLRSDDTDEDGSEDAGTTDSAESDDSSSAEDEADDSTESDDTDETSVTRRTAVSLLGVGALGGAGWYLSRGQLTAPDPAAETLTPDPPVEPSASISVTPADPAVGDEVTFSATDSTTGEGVSLETYEWAIGTDVAFVEGDPTRKLSFSAPGEQTVRLRVTDSQERSATATTTVAVDPLAEESPMFQYNAANTGTSSNATGPRTSITEQWSYQTGDSVFSSPAVVDDTVYVGSRDRSVYALSAVDGTEQWSYETGSEVFSSPAVVDGTVYIGSDDGNVYALSAVDGTEQWSFQTGNYVRSSPAVVDGTVYIGSWDEYMYALSAEDGTEQWSFQIDSFVGTAPAVVGGTVYLGSSFGSVYALSVADGSEQWSFQTPGTVSSPAVVDNTVYVGGGPEDGNVYALSAGDGTEQWAFQTGDYVASSPAVVDGTVYVGSDDQNVYALSAAEGTEQWSFQTGAGVNSSPAVVDDTVYVGSRDSSVYALLAVDGTEQWSYETGSEVFSSPAVVDGTVYIGSNNDNVYTLSE